VPEAAQSRTPRLGTGIGVLENLFRWSAEIGLLVDTTANHFFRSRHPKSQFTAEQRESAEQAGVTEAEIENAIESPATARSLVVPITADVNVDPDAQTALDEGEIQRRRDLVRILFNDFWSGTHDKPATFVERLDQAEDYLNERLAANGEFWRLNANTRAMLGLPLRSTRPH
jgi:hypothetical protein